MITNTLTEIIFRGSALCVDLSFLKILMSGCIVSRFDVPEVDNVIEYKAALEVISSNEYIDFVVTANKISIGERSLQNVFANLGLNEGHYELLLFFDLKDLDYRSYKASIDSLKEWTDKFQKDYNFEYAVCQLDNGSENEYYFDSNGLGPLYKQT